MAAELTDNSPVYLQARAKLRPLSCRWPAWPHLVAPAQHAMNLAFRHIPNLRSFIKTPSVHIAAGRDPATRGGSFVSLTENDVPMVQSLVADTTVRFAALLKFAEDLKALNARLQSTAKGMSLDENYATLPPSLRGLVELVYDLNGNPEVRLHEELTFSGELDNSAGDELCLHAIADAERKSFMNTPVLPGPDRVFVKARFDDPVVDELAALRVTPRPLNEVTRLLSRYGIDPHAVRSFLTERAPQRKTPRYTGRGIRLRYFGHACVLIETAAVSILVDPLTAWERNDEQASLTFDDLPDFIDLVIITQPHQDHFVPEMLLQLRRRVGKVIVPRNNPGCLADPSMRLILRRLGYHNISVVHPLDRLDIPGGEVLILPFLGKHCGLPISSRQCVVVRLEEKTLAFLVDSDGGDPTVYRRIRNAFGHINVLFLGMECHGAPLSWLYGPLLGKSVSRKEDESRRLNGADFNRAWGLLEQFNPDRVFVYSMGQEDWIRSVTGLEYGPDSVQLVESRNLLTKCQLTGIYAESLKGCREMFL